MDAAGERACARGGKPLWVVGRVWFANIRLDVWSEFFCQLNEFYLRQKKNVFLFVDRFGFFLFFFFCFVGVFVVFGFDTFSANELMCAILLKNHIYLMYDAYAIGQQFGEVTFPLRYKNSLKSASKNWLTRQYWNIHLRKYFRLETRIAHWKNGACTACCLLVHQRMIVFRCGN